MDHLEFEAIKSLSNGEPFYMKGSTLIWEGKKELQPSISAIKNEMEKLELKRLKKEHFLTINQKCKTEITSGFASSSLGAKHLYQSEKDDQDNLAGMKDRGIELPLKCSSNNGTSWTWKVHTVEQLKDVFNDGVDYKIALLIKAAQLKDLVNSSTNKDELNLIEWA